MPYGRRCIWWSVIGACAFGLAVCGAPAAHAEPDFGTAGDALVETLQGAVRLDTTNPPGDTSALAQFYAERLREAGVEPQFFESEPGQVCVVGRLKGTGAARPLLLLNHLDVVAAEPGEWEQDPFGGAIVDGKLYGRGTLDMKGLGVLQLETVRLLAKESVPLERDVIFLGVPDEEAGGARGAEWMVENHWEEVDAEYVLNEGASGKRDAFGPGSRVYFIQTAEKGVCWVRMTARGTSRHGSRPIPDNPNLYLLRALERIAAYETPVRLVPTVAKALRQVAPLIGGVKGDLWMRADNPGVLPLARPSLLADETFNPIVRTTINITNLESGYKVNVVPSTAMAMLDCRILPGETPEQLMALLEKLAHDPEAAEWEEEHEDELGRPLTAEERRQVQLEFAQQGAATESSVDSPVYQLIESVLSAHDPDAVVSPRMSAGGTDSRFWRERGVQAYGFAPFMLAPEQEGTVHGKNEYVDVADYRRSLPIYYTIVRRAAAGEM